MGLCLSFGAAYRNIINITWLGRVRALEIIGTASPGKGSKKFLELIYIGPMCALGLHWYPTYMSSDLYHVLVDTDRSLHWRHNERDGVSNHQPNDCLLNCLFRRRSKKTSKLRVTGLCAGNSPVTGEFPAQKASYAENVSIWWRHHGCREVYNIAVLKSHTSGISTYFYSG